MAMSIEKKLTDAFLQIPHSTLVYVIWENVHNSAKIYYITNWFNVTKPLWRKTVFENVYRK